MIFERPRGNQAANGTPLAPSWHSRAWNAADQGVRGCVSLRAVESPRSVVSMDAIAASTPGSLSWLSALSIGTSTASADGSVMVKLTDMKGDSFSVAG